MSRVWLVVTLVGVTTVLLKATGPVLLGGRDLPARVTALLTLLAPALLAALVVTQTLGGPEGLDVDERLFGLAAATLAIALRAPVFLVVVVAAGATAVARLM